MAEFKVTFANGVTESFSGAGARFNITQKNGVLTVFDGSGSRLRYAPGAWVSVEDTPADR